MRWLKLFILRAIFIFLITLLVMSFIFEITQEVFWIIATISMGYSFYWTEPR